MRPFLRKRSSINWELFLLKTSFKLNHFSVSKPLHFHLYFADVAALERSPALGWDLRGKKSWTRKERRKKRTSRRWPHPSRETRKRRPRRRFPSDEYFLKIYLLSEFIKLPSFAPSFPFPFARQGHSSHPRTATGPSPNPSHQCHLHFVVFQLPLCPGFGWPGLSAGSAKDSSADHPGTVAVVVAGFGFLIVCRFGHCDQRQR
jgi:hypothetical protein